MLPLHHPGARTNAIVCYYTKQGFPAVTFYNVGDASGASFTMAEINLFTIELSGRSEHVSAVRRAMRILAKEEGLSPDAGDDLCLAVGEACANAVEHGEQDCRIHVRARRSGRDIVIDIDSAGEYIPANAATMPETDAEGGRGRALMHALTDKVEYITQPGRTIVRLVKRIF